MMENRRKKIRNRAISFFYNPGRKAGIIHVAAAMAACLAIAATAVAADFTVSGLETGRKVLTGDNETGIITPSGDLRASNWAIYIRDPANGTRDNNTILNQGSVSVSGTAEARGIYSQPSTLTNSTIENAGTLTVSSTGTGWGGVMPGDQREATGMLFTTLDNTSVLNSGILSVSSSRSEVGIYASTLENGSTITNSGTLSMSQLNSTSTSRSTRGFAGYQILGNSALVNSGNLSVSGMNGMGIVYTAIKNGGTILNSGQIQINGADNAIGMAIGQMENGGIFKNTGRIFVTLTGAGKTGYGIRSKAWMWVPGMGPTAGTITNSGHIFLTTQDPSSTGYGVFSGNGDSLENSGTIESLDSTGAMGANMYSVKTTGSVTNSGTMRGLFEAGNTTNSGRITMPALTSTITGNYTQIGKGSLGIALFSDDNPANTKFSKLAVSGTTTLAPGSGFDVDVTTASALQELLIGQTLTGVIESAGGITADPATLYVTDNSALLRFIPVLSLGDTSLDLGVEKGMTIAQAAAMGGHAGVAGAAAALDTLTGSANPQISAFIADLNTLPTETGVGRRVQQAAPVSVAQGPAMATQMANTVSSVVQARQQGLKGFNSGDPMFSQKNAWVKPYASRVEQDGVDGVSGFRADTYGIGMGADGEFTQGNLGLAFFYTHAETRTNDIPQETDLDLFSLMAYGSSPIMGKTVNIDYQLGGGLAPTDSSRYIQSLGTSATADYTSKNLFARAKASREFALAENAKAIVGPVLSYLWFYTPSYEETGAGGMSLNVDSLDAQSLVAALEGDVIWSFPKDIEVMASASLGYDVINDTTFVSSQFQGGGAIFRTKGLDNSPLVYGAGLGLGKKFGDQFSIEAKYDLEGRGSDLLTQMVSARLNWRF